MTNSSEQNTTRDYLRNWERLFTLGIILFGCWSVGAHIDQWIKTATPEQKITNLRAAGGFAAGMGGVTAGLYGLGTLQQRGKEKE